MTNDGLSFKARVEKAGRGIYHWVCLVYVESHERVAAAVGHVCKLICVLMKFSKYNLCQSQNNRVMYYVPSLNVDVIRVIHVGSSLI